MMDEKKNGKNGCKIKNSTRNFDYEMRLMRTKLFDYDEM